MQKSQNIINKLRLKNRNDQSGPAYQGNYGSIAVTGLIL